MKKQFLFAAFAVALMASCTNEENPVVDPIIPEVEDKVAIDLGVNNPNITASRGTGTVGDVENEITGVSWNNQKLNIVMVDRRTGDYAKEDGEKVFDSSLLDFYAPSAGEDNLRIYVKNTYGVSETDKGTVKYKYYPVNGEFDFYGYHIDDATGAEETITPGATYAESVAKVTGITINGTQDILAAKTIEIPSAEPAQTLTDGSDNPQYVYHQSGLPTETWADMAAKQFSARTARNGFTPVLNFEHQLARLKFYVKSGNPELGAKYEKQAGNTYALRDSADVTIGTKTYENLATGAIYITNIVAEKMNNVIDVDLKTQTATPNGTTVADFALMSKVADQATLQELVPVAPTYPKNASNEPGYIESTPIGESMMFLPVENGSAEEIVLSLNLLQVVKDTYDEVNDVTTTFPKESSSRISLKAANVDADGDGLVGDVTAFEAGKSYNVYITIYSLEEIQITAQLTAWKDGGDVDLDIENDEYVEDNTTGE